MGSAALDLCDTACGRYTGLWQLKLAPWDIAAGALTVTEAGGVATDFSGSAVNLEVGDILAANATLHAWILAVLAGES